MYKLRIIGERDTIFVKEEDGKKIKKIWEDNDIPGDTKIVTKNWSGFKHSISSIILDEKDRDSEKQSNMDYFKQKDEEWKAKRAKIRSLPVDVRARDFAWFNFVKACMENPSMIENWEEELFNIQKEFFTNNPYKTLCTPKLFNQLFRYKITLNPMFAGLIKSAFVKDTEYSLKRM